MTEAQQNLATDAENVRKAITKFRTEHHGGLSVSLQADFFDEVLTLADSAETVIREAESQEELGDPAPEAEAKHPRSKGAKAESKDASRD